jgi:formyltetrahydrofolate hydrolase
MKILIKHLNGNISLDISQEISNSELIKLLSKEINYPFELMFGFEYLSENNNLNLWQIISKYDVNIDEIVLIATEKRVKNYEIGNEE